MGTRANSVDTIYCWLKTPSTGVLFVLERIDCLNNKNTRIADENMRTSNKEYVMDRQDHKRIKTRPTTAISHSPGVIRPPDDILAAIRNDYREAGKQLKRYNKFIDRHPQLILSTPFLSLLVLVVATLALTSTSGASNVVSILIFSVPTVLFLVSIVLGFVHYGRNSSANKIERKMKELAEEATQYRHVVALGLSENNISREELGLFRESLKEESLAMQQNEEKTKESGGLILLGWIALIVRFFTSWGAISAISIIASIAALIISIFLLASYNPTNKSNGKAILIIWTVITSILFIVAFNNAQQAQQTQNTQTCMTNARNAYDATVPNAAQSLIAETQACSNGQ